MTALAAAHGASRAAALFALSQPFASEVHLVESGVGQHAWLVDGSRLYDLDRESFRVLATAIADGSSKAALAHLQLVQPVRAIDDSPPVRPPVRALSLAVAQKCDLGCTYCYAREGSFGAEPQSMSAATAREAVDLLLSQAAPGERVNLSFLGGEPLVNRAVLRDATRYAKAEATRRGLQIGFSITSNGTLLDATDGEFFEEHGFAVTISLDGPREVHDRLRPYKGGRGSFDTVLRNVRPLLARQQRTQVSARVTVTPANLDLRGTLDELVALGFHSVGFSPLLSAPSGRGEMSRDDLAAMLDGMVACGEELERRTVAGRRYPFANLLFALQEIHKGTHRPYPCGAGAGYLGVSADGALAACHRFVGDPSGAMGRLADGVDRALQRDWLTERHVHRQEPCRSCWARYLCGGGCHHEVIHRGRPACKYIRGWLHYCLGAYARLSAVCPELFGASDPSAPRDAT
jgi:uncharacterized protein